VLGAAGGARLQAELPELRLLHVLLGLLLSGENAGAKARRRDFSSGPEKGARNIFEEV